MTAQQLSTMLSNLGDREVGIKLPTSSIGPTAYVPIESIEIGIDWDKGKVFIVPQKENKDGTKILR